MSTSRSLSEVEQEVMCEMTASRANTLPCTMRCNALGAVQRPISVSRHLGRKQHQRGAWSTQKATAIRKVPRTTSSERVHPDALVCNSLVSTTTTSLHSLLMIHFLWQSRLPEQVHCGSQVSYVSHCNDQRSSCTHFDQRSLTRP